MFAVASLCAY